MAAEEKIVLGELAKAQSYDDSIAVVQQSVAMFNHLSGGQLNPSAPSLPPWFQKSLTQLGGKTPDGQPRIRIVWGCEAVSWQMGRYRLTYLDPLAMKPMPIGWEIIQLEGLVTRFESLFYGEEESEGRYYRDLVPLEARGDSPGRIVYDYPDIGIPRWYIERWIDPLTACFGWPEDDDTSIKARRIRYIQHPYLGEVDAIGPRPRKGIWMEWLKLENPDGSYQAPNDKAYQAIQRMQWHELKQVKNHRPGERPSRHDVAIRLRAYHDAVTARREAWMEETEYQAGHAVTPTVLAQANNKLLFLPTGKKKDNGSSSSNNSNQ